MPYMPLVRCPECGTQFSAMKYKCPKCGKRRTMENDKEFELPAAVPPSLPEEEKAPAPSAPPKAQKASRLQTALGVGLITVGLLSAGFSALLFHQEAAKPEPTPEPVVTAAPRPTPTPTPTVESISLYAFGRDLSEGFTAYVGDEPLTLTVELEPELPYPTVTWRVSDKESAKLIVSADGLSCRFSALKPSGKNELIVQCYGMELSVPVYLWNK